MESQASLSGATVYRSVTDIPGEGMRDGGGAELVAGTVFVIALPAVMLAASMGPMVANRVARWARRRRFARETRQAIEFITQPGGISALGRTVRR